MTSRRPSSPPRDLGEAGTQFWRRCTKLFEFSEHELAILQLAAQQLDRIEEARAAIGSKPYVESRGALKAHPALTTERQSILLFSRLCRQLGLNDEPPAEKPAGNKFEVV